MKCEKCGEWVDWNNPAIHYSGHVCNPDRLKKEKETKTCSKCPEKYLEGYHKGFSDAIKQYGIDKR